MLGFVLVLQKRENIMEHFVLCISNRSRLNALSVTFDFFGESDWGSDWTKMDNVTLYYSIIILCNLGAKPNFLIWDDKE